MRARKAATLMVRALATGDVRSRDWSRMLGREFLVAARVGATMALAVSGIGIFRGGPDIAMVVAMSMIIIVLVGSLIGMSCPSSPPVPLQHGSGNGECTAGDLHRADATGVVIYFSHRQHGAVLPDPSSFETLTNVRPQDEGSSSDESLMLRSSLGCVSKHGGNYPYSATPHVRHVR